MYDKHASTFPKWRLNVCASKVYGSYGDNVDAKKRVSTMHRVKKQMQT